MSKLFILCLLISGNALAEKYTVGCYGTTGFRTIQGTFDNYEAAEDQITHIKITDPDFDCDIQLAEELEDDN